MDKKQSFLKIAERLNTELNVFPLLYGSLGLQQRTGEELYPDDIDVLIPEVYLNEKWSSILSLMNSEGYELYDLHEHAFSLDGVSVAFAAIESLEEFAGIDISAIPFETENGVQFRLLELHDYLKVYSVSAKDGYRKDKKNKKDTDKIHLITQKLSMFNSENRL